MANVFNNVGAEQFAIDASTSTGTLAVSENKKNKTTINQGKTSTTATSRTDTYTVPTGKFWLVKRLYATRANSAAVTILINGLQLFAAATTEKEYILDDWRIEDGDEVQFQFSSGTSGNLTSEVYYEEYDI